MLFIIAISTFVCITLGVVGLYWLLFKPASAATERLRQMQEGTTVTGASTATLTAEAPPVTDFAGRIATPISRLVPPSASEVRKIQKQLMQAGFRGENAVVIYRAMQLISLISFPAMVAFLCAVTGRSMMSALLFIIFAFLLGFVLPRFLLGRLIKGRQLRVRWGLADALDLMVVSIEAGLGLNAAMLRISDELRYVHPDISHEFELANLEIRVGREREEALRNLAERTGVDDLRSLVAMLIQADRFGTSIARAVRVFSDSLRTKRRQRAEQAAQKAAVKLLLPLACFLFPTLFIAILGPAAITLIDTLGNM